MRRKVKILSKQTFSLKHFAWKRKYFEGAGGEGSGEGEGEDHGAGGEGALQPWKRLQEVWPRSFI